MMILDVPDRLFGLNHKASEALKRKGPVVPARLSKDRWAQSLTDPTEFYGDCFRYFHHQIPKEIKEHRAFFFANKRGCGEDAFHTMWYLLSREYKLSRFVEIGVYRGQILSLVALLQRMDGAAGHVCGISPFDAAGDSVSRYDKQLDYFEDTLSNFRHFGLNDPKLIKAYSTDPDAVSCLASGDWDCVYIDGGHDYEVVLQDWRNCSEFARPGTLLVLDDASLQTPYKPPRFASKGHPGPSQVAAEIDRSRFSEILQVGHNRVFLKL